MSLMTATAVWQMGLETRVENKQYHNSQRPKNLDNIKQTTKTSFNKQHKSSKFKQIIMRPPSTLLPSHTVLWLFCTTLLIFYNIAADAQQSEEQLKSIGLAGIIPKEELQNKKFVELHKDSWYITEKEQLVGYGYTEYEHKDKTFKPCNVDISGDGIEVFYDDMAAKEGCTVDLLVNETDRALFTAKMKNNNTDCISEVGNEVGGIVVKSNDNLIPFVFGYLNDNLKKLSKPVYGGICPDNAADTCKALHNGQDDKCIELTMLEIGWSRSKDKLIYGHLHQVGEPVSSWYIKMNKNEWNGKMDVDLKIIGMNEGKPTIEYHIKKPGKTEGFQFIEGKEGDQPICNIPNSATRTPSTWEIKSTADADQFFNGKHLLSLHFFPQSTTVSKNSDGPNCKGQSFVFPRSFAAGLLMVGPIPEPELTTSLPSTQSTIEMTTGSEGTASGSNGTNETTATAPMQAESGDSSNNTLLIIGIVAGVIVLIILIGLLIYCLCCRKKEEDGDEEVPSDVKNDDDDEKKQQSETAVDCEEAE